MQASSGRFRRYLPLRSLFQGALACPDLFGPLGLNSTSDLAVLRRTPNPPRGGGTPAVLLAEILAARRREIGTGIRSMKRRPSPQISGRACTRPPSRILRRAYTGGTLDP